MSELTRVTLYTKPGCHLCEATERVILDVRDRREFRLVVRNVLSDAADAERYKNHIPVVTVNGHEIARHRLSAAELELALDAVEA